MVEAGKSPGLFQTHYALGVMSYVLLISRRGADFVNFTSITMWSGLLSEGVA